MVAIRSVMMGRIKVIWILFRFCRVVRRRL